MEPTPLKKQKIPILMYHSISKYVTAQYRPFTVSPELFAEHMAYLHEHAYTPITVTQFGDAIAQGVSILPTRPVILTFDDGFTDFFTEALPVIRQYGFTATLYVTTGFIGKRQATGSMLDWEQLGEISQCGIECGGHSHSHRQLDTLTPTVARDEIVRCKWLLEDRLGQEILSFAYPHGYHCATTKRLVREAGYTSACAVGYAMCSIATDPFALTRLRMGADTSVDALAALLASSIPSVVTMLYKRPLTLGWRLIRVCSARLSPASAGTN
jgi:peptidoglycan/xylan/chitin deacetylase (PgdA/CDA1 family)